MRPPFSALWNGSLRRCKMDTAAYTIAAAWATSAAELPLVWEWVEDKLVITALQGEIAGLKRGDVVLQIDGKPAADVLREAESFISGATPQWRRYRALNAIRSGAAGATVTLEVKSRDNPPAMVKLPRKGGVDWQLLAELRNFAFF